MNINFNRQFLLTDFRLLDNREFIKFIKSREYATYVVLRRNVWRSSEPHYMRLHEMYLEKQLLVSSLERKHIAQALYIQNESEVSRMLTGLEKKGIIKRMRTGRQSIYILGEWIDVLGDGSYKGVEWFYFDGVFGLSKEDIKKGVKIDVGEFPTSDVGNSQHQPKTSTIGGKSSLQSSTKNSRQRRAKTTHNNREENREENTITGTYTPNMKSTSKWSAVIKQLKDLELPKEKIEYIAQEIAKKLKDKNFLDLFRLIAAKIPESVIWQNLSEILHDGGVEDLGKVFTYRMGRHAAFMSPSSKNSTE